MSRQIGEGDIISAVPLAGIRDLVHTYPGSSDHCSDENPLIADLVVAREGDQHGEPAQENPMIVLGILTDPAVVEKILWHLGLPCTPPVRPENTVCRPWRWLPRAEKR